MKSFISFFVVILIVLNAQGQCNPMFTATATPTISAPLNYTFTNNTVTSAGPGTLIHYTLVYGDNSVNFQFTTNWANSWNTWTTVSHNYPVAGTYQAVLYMNKTDSATNTSCYDTIMHVITVAQSPCLSSFTSVKNPANNGQVTFTANNPANTPGIVYSWDFGDGNTGSGSPITHTYANSASSYNVTLVATVPAVSCSFTATGVVHNVVNGCTAHIAAFTANVNQIFTTTGYFANQTPSFGQWNSLTWDYGDGTTGTQSSHVYNGLGTYTVTLTYNWLDSPSNNIICSSTASHTVSITQYPTSNISGHIAIDTNAVPASPDTFKVWLIQYNSSNSMLAAIDSVVVSGMTTWVPYTFHNVFSGNYLVKAKRLNGPVSGSGPVPTYHYSSLYWNSALSVVHNAPYSAPYVDILMQSGTITAGPGFIGGNVNMGANKGTGGAAVPGMEIILRNTSNEPVAYTYTDVNGDYGFSNLPLGTYSIYPEEMNYVSTPYTSVQLTTASPSKSGYVFGVINDEIRPKTTEVANLPNEDKFVIYPNPSNGKVVINWAKTPADYKVTVSDIAGHVVYTTSNQAQLDLSRLQQGLYFIKLQSEQMNATQKIMVQH